MGVLQDFERRLEGAVEGFFARAFRAGLQPVELAKALRRYAEDTQHVTADGVVVPNVYRFTLNPRDVERLASFGDKLNDELAEVATRTAEERNWRLRGPAEVRIERSEDVSYGMYELTARIAESGRPAPAEAPESAAAPSNAGKAPAVRIVGGGSPRTVALTGERMVAGRLPACDVSLDDGTVSREHAAFVRRADGWWVLDLGSTNGTKVNGVTAAEQALHDGDRIELGEAVLEFVGS